VGGPATICDDKNPCTTDSCDPAKGCLTANVGDGAGCSQASCTSGAAPSWQQPGTCAAGQCAIPLTKSCDDGNSCTTDTCDVVKGCAVTTNPWGSACTPTDKTLADPFCAGTLCTGFEVKLAQTGGSAATKGVLTGLDRNANGIYASGWDNQFNPNQGAMSGIVESPLGITAKGAEQQNSRLFDMRGRVAVGASNSNFAQPTRMVLDPASGFWTNGGFSIANLTRALTGVDLVVPAPGIESYWLGGLSDNNNDPMSLAAHVNFTNNTWGPVTRLLVSQAGGAACQNQVRLDIGDVYAASDSAVFFVGSISNNGQPVQSAVAFYDGNKAVGCDGINNYVGEAYVNSPALTGDLLVSINAGTNPPIGQFRAVHGTSATHVMVGGSAGTLFSYDAGKWTQQTPSYAGMPVAWGAGFDVKSVALAGKDAWAAGEFTVTSGGATCKALFGLHGVFDGTTWSWNKLVISQKLLSCGVLDSTFVGKVWIDPTSASVYFAGSQGTDAAGAPVATNAAQTRQLIVRAKMQ
jgi:hypothetical protein